jgi:hypothetical protein
MGILGGRARETQQAPERQREGRSGALSFEVHSIQSCLNRELMVVLKDRLTMPIYGWSQRKPDLDWHDKHDK